MIRVLVVDDEPLARMRLRSLIEGLAEPPAQVAGEAANADAAFAWLRGAPLGEGADVVLLDIAMPGPDGLALAQALKTLKMAGSPPAVVFVTAHAEHALAAFELEAADYLTKPVRRERLQAALQRVAQRRGLAAAADAGPALVVSDRGRVLRLPLAEVLWLKAEQKYVTLRTPSHRWVLDDALADLEQRLAELGGVFVRIHRNALVARHAVRALEKRGKTEGESDGGADEGWAVRVAPTGEWLAVSRRQLAAVREALAA